MNQDTDAKERIDMLEKKLNECQHKVGILENVLNAAKDVMTLEEAAIFMGVCKSTLYKMTHELTIPFYKPNGKMVYFERAELMKWIRQNRVSSYSEIEASVQTL